MIPRGVKLEQKKEPSLKNPIETLSAPKGISAPKMFAPLRKKAAASKILLAARMAGIVDELDGALLEQKLSGPKADLIVACGFDEDPYTTAASAVLREQPELVADGLELAAQACGAAVKKVAVASHAEAKHLPAGMFRGGVLVAGRRYPAATLLWKKLSRGGRRTVLIGAQALAALAAAAKQGRSQCETVVTVAGDGVHRWSNFRVRIGTPIKTLLEAAEPDESIAAVAVGSSVRGRTVADLSEPVAADTRCLLAMKKVPSGRAYPCVGCSRCVRACPRGILPWMVLRELARETPDTLRLYNVQNCDGCGACCAVCPSHADLVAAVKRAAALKKSGGTHETA